MTNTNTRNEMVALCDHLGYAVNLDTSTEDLEKALLGDVTFKESSVFLLQRRINKMIKSFSSLVSLDCSGDCFSCPAAQTVRCWITSKANIEKLETRVEVEMELYTMKDLEEMRLTELYTVAMEHLGRPKHALYGMSKSVIIDEFGAKGLISDWAKKEPENTKEKSAPDEAVETEAAAPAPKRGRPVGKRLRESTAGEKVQVVEEAAAERSDPDELKRLIREVARLAGVSGAGEKSSPAGLKEEIALVEKSAELWINNLSEKTLKRLKALDEKVEALEAFNVAITAALAQYMGAELEGASPLEQIEDLISRLPT